MLVLNWVCTYLYNERNICKTSDFCFIKYIQVNYVQSSTIVIKYLNPSTLGSWKAPQTSIWIRSKGFGAKVVLDTKDNHFCLAKWHVEQCTEEGLEVTLVNTFFIAKNFSYERWPKLDLSGQNWKIYSSVVPEVVVLLQWGIHWVWSSVPWSVLSPYSGYKSSDNS